MNDSLLELTEEAIKIQQQKIEVLVIMMKNFMRIVDHFIDEVDMDLFDDEWVEFVLLTVENGQKIVAIEEQKGTMQ